MILIERDRWFLGELVKIVLKWSPMGATPHAAANVDLLLRDTTEREQEYVRARFPKP